MSDELVGWRLSGCPSGGKRPAGRPARSVRAQHLTPSGPSGCHVVPDARVSLARSQVHLLSVLTLAAAHPLPLCLQGPVVIAVNVDYSQNECVAGWRLDLWGSFCVQPARAARGTCVIPALPWQAARARGHRANPPMGPHGSQLLLLLLPLLRSLPSPLTLSPLRTPPCSELFKDAIQERFH